MAYANSWLTAAAKRISADAALGSIDALLARYFLGSAPVPGLNQDSSRLSAAWLRRTGTAFGRHLSWPRSATVSLPLFPACRPAPGACSSPV